ncbi:MAG TPA: type 1 glutamine amidotransferase [Caulobacteraceae bacterium]|nr:type 1 glutamine amidotransferase [Caulobacteraceae bacterium]
MRFAILETGVPPGDLAERHGDYPDMFEALVGLGPMARFAVDRGQWPDAPEAYDGYLITGSPAGVYDPLPWVGQLMTFLQAAKGKAALVGVCFGHQAMAQAFGGQVIKSPKGWGIGRHVYELSARAPWMDGAAEIAPLEIAPLEIALAASHQDQVVQAPPGAQVIAASAFTPFAALAYPGQRALSFQGHPEFTPEFAKALMTIRRGKSLTEAEADAAIASLDLPDDGRRVGGWIRAFLEGGD